MKTALTVLKNVTHSSIRLDGEVELMRSWAQDNERDLGR
jgi:hypothetical protein